VRATDRGNQCRWEIANVGVRLRLLERQADLMRRLSALFVVALILAMLVLGALRVRDNQKYALFVATSVTLIVWITPLLHVLRDSIRYRLLSLDALRPVSTFVRFTYGFALAATPMVAMSVALNGTRGLHLAALLRLVAVAGLIALPLYAGSCNGRLRGSLR